MKKNKLSNRLEIRVDAELSKSLERYGSAHDDKQSEILRKAVALYIECGPLKYLLLDHIQEAHFRKIFKKFLKDCPGPLKMFFERFLGPEEERKSAGYALNLPGIVDSFVTAQGKKSYLERCRRWQG